MMSSKFSHTTQTMKPPHVCRKPPPGPEYIPPPIVDQDIQGFVEYFDPVSPSEGGMISPIDMFPTAAVNTWAGSATAGIYRAELQMTTNAQRSLLSYQLDWYVGNILYDTIVLTDLPARSWAPFDSGQLTPMPQPWHGRIGWHLWF